MNEDDIIIDVGGEPLSADDKTQLDADLKEIIPDNSDTKPETPPEVKAETAPENNSEDDQLGPEHDDKTEEEREAIRARRRKERADKKNFRREKEDSYKREIEGLRKQLNEVNEWKNTVERRNMQSGVAQLEQALKETDDTIELAKQALKEAMDSKNGDALVDAQELYFAARKRKEDLELIKKRTIAHTQQQQRPTIDPVVAKNAQQWMKDKEWYDPRGTNKDSKIVMILDSELNEEGWDPRTPEYWQELDERAKKLLQHRYNSTYNEPKRDVTIKNPPTGGSGGTNRPSASNNFTLSPERVRAMKEAGMWDDPEKRKAMIRRYIDQDKASKGA